MVCARALTLALFSEDVRWVGIRYLRGCIDDAGGLHCFALHETQKRREAREALRVGISLVGGEGYENGVDILCAVLGAEKIVEIDRYGVCSW